MNSPTAAKLTKEKKGKRTTKKAFDGLGGADRVNRIGKSPRCPITQSTLSKPTTNHQRRILKYRRQISASLPKTSSCATKSGNRTRKVQSMHPAEKTKRNDAAERSKIENF